MVLCCVFALFFFVLLPVSLDYPFLIEFGSIKIMLGNLYLSVFVSMSLHCNIFNYVYILIYLKVDIWYRKKQYSLIKSIIIDGSKGGGTKSEPLFKLSHRLVKTCCKIIFTISPLSFFFTPNLFYLLIFLKTYCFEIRFFFLKKRPPIINCIIWMNNKTNITP